MARSSFSALHRRLRAALIDARRERALTQAALATRLGRPQSFVSKYESGERRLDVIEFMEVLDAIGVDAAEVLMKVGRASPQGNK